MSLRVRVCPACLHGGFTVPSDSLSAVRIVDTFVWLVCSDVASEVSFRLPLDGADGFPALFDEIDARQVRS